MKKSLILFVHGIDGSSTTTWGAFPDLVRADREVSARYDVALDDYPTRKTGRLFERIGGLDSAAEGLRTRLANLHVDYDDIAIIAHSQGGLIAVRYMLDRIMRTEPMPLTRLLTYATPYAGATAGSLGDFLGFGSEQTKDLAPEGDFLFRLNRDWGLFREQHRVSMKAVIAGCDGVVGAGSAAVLGIPFEMAASSNHQPIVKPEGARHESFVIAKRFLLGHSGQPRTSPPLMQAMKLSEEARTALHGAWEKLDERLSQKSNLWREQWDEPRSRFEAAFAKAAETGRVECWQAVIEAGSLFRETIRASVEDEFDLPPHYTALTAYTDKVQIALKAAGGTPGNALPPEHEAFKAGIENVSEKIGEERVQLADAKQAVEAGSSREKQIAELFRRLDEVEKELAASRNMAIQVEQINIVNVDPVSIVALIRDALEALKHGVDLLNDKRFTEALRRAAKDARGTGQRYVEAVRRRFAALRLPWRQETVFDDLERQEPNFGLSPRTQIELADAEVPALRINDASHTHQQEDPFKRLKFESILRKNFYDRAEVSEIQKQLSEYISELSLPTIKAILFRSALRDIYRLGYPRDNYYHGDDEYTFARQVVFPLIARVQACLPLIWSPNHHSNFAQELSAIIPEIPDTIASSTRGATATSGAYLARTKIVNMFDSFNSARLGDLGYFLILDGENARPSVESFIKDVRYSNDNWRGTIETPVWRDGAPTRLNSYGRGLHGLLHTLPDGDVWTSWLQERERGASVNMDLELARAKEMSRDDWTSGPEFANAKLKQILRREHRPV